MTSFARPLGWMFLSLALLFGVTEFAEAFIPGPFGDVVAMGVIGVVLLAYAHITGGDP